MRMIFEKVWCVAEEVNVGMAVFLSSETAKTVAEMIAITTNRKGDRKREKKKEMY